jgi:hypothetical protein
MMAEENEGDEGARLTIQRSAVLSSTFLIGLVVPDCTAGCSAHLTVTGHMAGNATDDRTFHAALRVSGRAGEKAEGKNGSRNGEALHS